MSTHIKAKTTTKSEYTSSHGKKRREEEKELQGYYSRSEKVISKKRLNYDQLGGDE